MEESWSQPPLHLDNNDAEQQQQQPLQQQQEQEQKQPLQEQHNEDMPMQEATDISGDQGQQEAPINMDHNIIAATTTTTITNGIISSNIDTTNNHSDVIQNITTALTESTEQNHIMVDPLDLIDLTTDELASFQNRQLLSLSFLTSITINTPSTALTSDWIAVSSSALSNPTTPLGQTIPSVPRHPILTRQGTELVSSLTGGFGTSTEYGSMKPIAAQGSTELMYVQRRSSSWKGKSNAVGSGTATVTVPSSVSGNATFVIGPGRSRVSTRSSHNARRASEEYELDAVGESANENNGRERKDDFGETGYGHGGTFDNGERSDSKLLWQQQPTTTRRESIIGNVNLVDEPLMEDRREGGDSVGNDLGGVLIDVVKHQQQQQQIQQQQQRVATANQSPFGSSSSLVVTPIQAARIRSQSLIWMRSGIGGNNNTANPLADEIQLRQGGPSTGRGYSFPTVTGSAGVIVPGTPLLTRPTESLDGVNNADAIIPVPNQSQDPNVTPLREIVVNGGATTESALTEGKHPRMISLSALDYIGSKTPSSSNRSSQSTSPSVSATNMITAASGAAAFVASNATASIARSANHVLNKMTSGFLISPNSMTAPNGGMMLAGRSGMMPGAVSGQMVPVEEKTGTITSMTKNIGGAIFSALWDRNNGGGSAGMYSSASAEGDYASGGGGNATVSRSGSMNDVSMRGGIIGAGGTPRVSLTASRKPSNSKSSRGVVPPEPRILDVVEDPSADPMDGFFFQGDAGVLLSSATNNSSNVPNWVFRQQIVPGHLLTKFRPNESTLSPLQEKLIESKLTFSTGSVSFSVKGGLISERMGISLALEAVKRKVKVESYANLLNPSKSLVSTTADYTIYNPFYLDDPELKTGKHRTVITLPCFIARILGSIIQYSRPADIKRELNEHFRETHPMVDSMLTLSNIRNLKARLMSIAQAQNIELSSVACAYVYFEKLVLKNYVTKANRKLIAAVCLLLAVKINDPKETKYSKLLEVTENVLEVPAKEVYQHEFAVFVALEFTLI
ncbi:hypothetical protein HDU76_002968 [Blyttiomyces sp. JEL0837]|nr:hypothetical protein HDU76_002968 [Blyttiomyces sp. JEL0837]